MRAVQKQLDDKEINGGQAKKAVNLLLRFLLENRSILLSLTMLYT